ncbi:MAG: sugar phosphate isomerase/epimerase, partial [Candidatus Omnitrophica bacterium]|nr:sugar phosphate isomerase/epimerase [Candidatus Omnitrophota bacterium]
FNQLRIDGGWVKKTVAEKDYKSLIIKGIKRAVEIAEKEKVYLALDNHGTITNDYQFQIEIFEKIKSKYLGANLDTMNYRWYGYPVEDLLKIYKSIAPYAIHTHIKDGIGVKENYTGKIIGEGEIPVSQVIRILKENNYQGVWCIEYEGKDKDSGYKESTGKLRRLLE